ncbi:MAG: hypothetical protein WA782_13660 [Sulfitobacter sp.]
MKSQTQKRSDCKTMCWIIGAIAGLLLMILLYKFIGLGGFGSFLLGVIGGLLLAYFLPNYICKDAEAGAGAGTVSSRAGGAGSAAATGQSAAMALQAAAGDAGVANVNEAANTSTATTSSAASTSSATTTNTTAAPLMAAGIKPSTPLSGEAELASRKGTWKYEAPVAEKKPAVKKAGAKKPAAAKADAAPKKAAAKTATATKAEVVKTAAKAPAKAAAKRTPVAADGKPQVYDTPPATGSDDLKQISGVGPKLEQTLNELGIYRFEQVAGWRKKEIEWVDARLRFKGRIARDDWMSQAKILAKGGETEFSKRKKT